MITPEECIEISIEKREELFKHTVDAVEHCLSKNGIFEGRLSGAVDVAVVNHYRSRGFLCKYYTCDQALWADFWVIKPYPKLPQKKPSLFKRILKRIWND